MSRGGSGFPYFLWQEKEDDWTTLSYIDVSILNRAAAMDQKRVTLPCGNPRRQRTVYFEKMCCKNELGAEKQIRCLIFNNMSVYAVWTWNKDSGDNYRSLEPRLAYFLEVLYQKNVPKFDLYFETEYEVDFPKSIIKEKKTGTLYSFVRDDIGFINPPWESKYMQWHVYHSRRSENLMKTLCTYNIVRIKNLLYNTPIYDAEIYSKVFHICSRSKDLISVLEREEDSSKEMTLVDPYYYSGLLNECHVFTENDCAFSATLTLTVLEKEINEFCIIQLLKFNNRKHFSVWSRSGRVGLTGYGNLEMFSNINDAKEEFEKMFFLRTENLWSERLNFQRKPMKYDYIHTFFNAGNPKNMLNDALENIQSKMDKNMQIFLGENSKLLIKKWLLLQSVSVKVGMPTRKQLLQAVTAFIDVTKVLNEKDNGKKLKEACDKYYMKMPHDIKCFAPKMILSAETIEEEAYMLQALGYSSVNNLAESNSLENPMDSYLKYFQWSLTHLDHKSEEFKALHESLTQLQGPTHTYKIDLIDAFKWHKQSEEERFIDKGNKLLLWHGTRLSDFIGIVKHGLKLPSVKARISTSMFGRALYFADVSSKSANYGTLTKNEDFGLLLLCEVSMGASLEVFHGGDYSTHPKCFGGVMALGEYYPSAFVKTILAPDALMPKGPLKKRFNKDLSLKYNEYVVYDERRVKILYLLKVKFPSSLS